MPRAIDKQLVSTRFRRRMQTYNRSAGIQAEMARQLVERLVALRGARHLRTLEIGCGTGLLTEVILSVLDVCDLYVNDLVEQCRGTAEELSRIYSQVSIHFIPGDIEKQSGLPDRLDLVISNATFHWLEDLAALLKGLSERLVEGGILAFSTFGPGNLDEIRVLLGDSLPYLSSETLETLLSRHFTVLLAEEREAVLEFPSPRHVLDHLRQTGSNALRRLTWNRSALAGFEQRYRELFFRNGAVTLTYHPMTLVAEKKACRSSS